MSMSCSGPDPMCGHPIRQTALRASLVVQVWLTTLLSPSDQRALPLHASMPGTKTAAEGLALPSYLPAGLASSGFSALGITCGSHNPGPKGPELV